MANKIIQNYKFFYKFSQFGKDFRKSNKQFNNKFVDQTLKGLDAYTLHKLERIKFPRNKVNTSDEQWQIELADVRKTRSMVFYIFVCIDVLSKIT